MEIVEVGLMNASEQVQVLSAAYQLALATFVFGVIIGAAVTYCAMRLRSGKPSS